MTTAVAETLEQLLNLRAEHGSITPVEVADAVLANDLDEQEAEALELELEAHGAAPEVEEEELALDLSIGWPTTPPTRSRCSSTRPAATRCSPRRRRSSWPSASSAATWPPRNA
jgi:hypothetical protein